MRPEEFAERMRALPTGDPETDHDEGDQLMAEALRSMGFHEGVVEWESWTKWYA